MNFCTKICDLNKNYIYHGEKQPHQEVRYGYIFVKVLVKTSTCTVDKRGFINIENKQRSIIKCFHQGVVQQTKSKID